MACFSAAKTINLDWTVDWVTAAPDGFVRPVIGINGQWPCPTIDADVGDTISLKLSNNLGNETTGLHFHGISQISTPDMDGPSGVTQCPVPPGSSVTYQFVVPDAGTYWYHSHNMGQYPDGLRGPLIVHDPNDPYKDKYDEEVILTVSDWYHDQTIDLVRDMLQPSNTLFLPRFPDGIIVNEGGSAQIPFVKGKTYRLRIISFAAFASAMLHFDSHTMQVIMNDGSYIQQAQAYQLRISPAQRYDVLISAIDRDHRNYPFLFSLDINRDFTKPDPVWPNNFTGQLVMDSTKPFTEDVVDVWRPVDDSHFKPFDSLVQFGPVTTTVVLDFDFCFDENDYPRACFNGQTYIPQKVPTLYSVASTGTSNTNPAIYGAVNPIVVGYGEVVQLVINNNDAAVHPFHLHGHQFQVLDRPRSDTGPWPKRGSGVAQPPRRDVVHVNANSHAVLRFRADNPGVFLFHCHIEWHVEMGLTATIIEAPEKLRGLQFPDDHIHNCRIQNIPFTGNAGGNTGNFTDTTNFVTTPPTVYNGALYFPPPTRPRVVRRRL
ncbi:hypothetical protein VTK73DRAFT_2863 [Phialemonium thermophilum]|uniref:Laccase n=1 Tax=Phialemonium thermophilum TaxID=223376 RepID=A0ABR3X289_9PEZI